MARIRRSNTKPEWVVRRLLHKLGYRYRLQWKAAPGRPDVASPGKRKVIFVHGCFWHQHPSRRVAHLPATRREFWEAKFARNKAPDARDLARAEAEGWSPLVVWECEVKDGAVLRDQLSSFLRCGKVRHREQFVILDLASRPRTARIA